MNLLGHRGAARHCQSTPTGSCFTASQGVNDKWDTLEDEPSEAPGLEGVAPRKLATALCSLGRKQ